MPRTLAALVLALIVSQTSSALVIDSFEDPALAIANAGTPDASDFTFSGLFPGTRELQAYWVSGPNNVHSEIDAADSGLLGFSRGADTDGDVAVAWGDTGGIDLTDGGTSNAIVLDIVFNDLSAPITLFAQDGIHGFSELTLTAPGGISASTPLAFLFSAFIGDVDFTQIEGLELQIDPLSPTTDLRIDQAASMFVPEPGTGLLVGLGVLALCMRDGRPRPRRKSSRPAFPGEGSCRGAVGWR